jgi:hypothetical protein
MDNLIKEFDKIFINLKSTYEIKDNNFIIRIHKDEPNLLEYLEPIIKKYSKNYKIDYVPKLIGYIYENFDKEKFSDKSSKVFIVGEKLRIDAGINEINHIIIYNHIQTLVDNYCFINGLDPETFKDCEFRYVG